MESQYAGLPDQTIELARQTVHPVGLYEGDKPQQILQRAKGYLEECFEAEKRWRKRAEEGWDFYDNNQWKPKDIAILKARGQDPITINETTRTVDLILGLQSVQPMDWIGRPMGEGDNDESEVVSGVLKFIHNVNYGKDVFQDIYKHSLCYGFGVARVGYWIRDVNQKAEPVQFISLDPREVHPDPRHRNRDYSDARFVIHRRKVTLGAAKWLIAQYKKADKDGRMEMVGDNDQPDREMGVTDTTGVPPVTAWDEVDWNQAEKVGNWKIGDMGVEGREVYINEIWEKYTAKGILAWDPMGIPFEVDQDDPAAMSILADPEQTSSWDFVDLTRVRYHIWTGDLLIATNESPFNIDRFPFVFCYHKRDKYGDPVSLIEQMKDPQSDINHRRSRLLWGLLTRRGRISSRVLQRMGITIEEAQEMMSRPDALFEADENEIELLPNAELPAQQFDLMQDAKLSIRGAAGINEDLIGNQTTARSGIAKQIAASQGQLSLRPKEASLRMCHKLTGELLWQLAQQIHAGTPWPIRVTDDMGASRFFVINKPDIDPASGQKHITNELRQFKIDVEIDDTAWTPTQQQRASEVLLDLTGQIPDPMTRMKVMALALIAGDIPKKRQVMSIISELMAPKDAIMPTPRPPTLTLRPEDLTPMEQAQAIRRAGMEPDPSRSAAPAPPGTPTDPVASLPPVPQGMGADMVPPWAQMPGGVPPGGMP